MGPNPTTERDAQAEAFIDAQIKPIVLRAFNIGFNLGAIAAALSALAGWMLSRWLA